MIKVVYNARYGGFGISVECALYMAARGHAEAKELINRYDVSNQYGAADSRDKEWYGDIRCDRHDPLLVEAVETLGFGAGDSDHDHDDKPQLRIHNISGDRYFIKEYDGMERVMEPSDFNWVCVT